MQFSEQYHYFFDNKGRCPECGKMLIMSFGCINFNCEIAREHICTIGGKKEKMSIMNAIFSYYYFAFDKDKYYKDLKLRKLQNLDKQPKKQYIKTDDSGISE